MYWRVTGAFRRSLNRMVADLSLTELGDGVYAWLLPGGETGVANAGVVVEPDGITVIDTLMVRSQWEPFAAAVAALELPVRRTILTHAHIDHVGGTKAFPNAAIYATPITSDALDQPMPIDGYKQFMPAFDEEFDDLAELGTRAVTHLVEGAAQLTARIEVLPAPGHTPGDLVVLVSDVDVCFAGDAVVELADTIVPGHGPIGGEPEVRDLQGYLRACVAARGDVAAIPAGPWDQWLDRDRDAINVERAALLASGEDAMPPSMLKAIGLA